MGDEQGVVYVSASGVYFSAPEITAEILYNTLQNGYIAEQLDKVTSKIFSGMYELSVINPDGEVDEEITNELLADLKNPKVALWSRMKQAWEDIWCWGCSPQFPIWTKEGNRVVLGELRRLPPESFANPPYMTNNVYSDLLQGILLNDSGELELYQTQDVAELLPQKLKPGVQLFKDPSSTKLAGQSKAVYLVPLIKMINFCWEAQMQKVNRVGAPIMFIKISAPYDDGDVAYAQVCIQNWGKGKAYTLRPNMEAVGLNVTDSESALETIEKLEKRLEAPFKAGSSVQAEGSSIGDSGNSQKESEDDWILGQRTMIEEIFENFLQLYLDYNGYEDYSVEIKIAYETTQPGQLEISQATAGYNTRCMTINERRQKLGLPELAPDKLDELLDEIAKTKKALGGTSPLEPEPEPAVPGFEGGLQDINQRAELVDKMANIDPMNPEKFMTEEEQMTFLRSGKLGGA